MTIKLKPITETSWLVLGDTEDIRVGLLTESRDKYILMAKGEKKSFLSRKDVNTYFEQDIFQNMIESSKEESIKKDYHINGFPVDFDNPYEVIIKGGTLPLFSKKASGEIYYAAGYYCLEFPKQWMGSFCPKYSTLQEYKFKGPFSTEIEMKLELSKLRKINNYGTYV